MVVSFYKDANFGGRPWTQLSVIYLTVLFDADLFLMRLCQPFPAGADLNGEVNGGAGERWEEKKG